MKKTISIGVVVVILNFINPLFYSAFRIYELEFIKIWLVYGLVGLGWIILLSGKGYVLPMLPSSVKKYVIVFFSIYGGLSLISISPVNSLMGSYGLWIHSVVSFVSYFSIYYFTYIVAYQYRKTLLRLLSASIMSSALFVCIKALSTKKDWSIKGIFTVDRIASPFYNAHHLGFYLTIVLLFSFWSVVMEKKVFLRILSSAVLLLSSFTLIMTFTRTSWIAALLTVSLTLIYYKKYISVIMRDLYTKITFLLLIILVLVFSTTLFSRLSSGFAKGQIRQSYKIRLHEWYTSYKVWVTRPYGIGPETLGLIYPQYRDVIQNTLPEEWNWRTVTVRNYWLELLVTVGPLGVGAFLLFIWSVWKSGKNEQMLTQYFAGILAFLIHGFFYKVSVSNFVLFFTFAGIATSDNNPFHHIKTFHLPKTIRSFIVAVTMVGIYLLISSGIGQYWSVRSQSIIDADLGEIQWYANVLAYNHSFNAYAWYPYFDNNLRNVIKTQSVVLMDWHNDPIFRHSVLRTKMLDKYYLRLRQLEKRSLLNMENLKVLSFGYMRYASFLDSKELKTAMYDRAIDYSTRLVQYDPTWADSWDTLGVVYLDSQNYKKAIDTFQYILSDIKNDYPYAYFHIGETYRQMGRPQDAIPHYEKAVALGYEGGLREIEEAKQESNSPLTP